jgi:hypothetical protein
LIDALLLAEAWRAALHKDLVRLDAAAQLAQGQTVLAVTRTA